ncbi:putative RNA-binding Zn ribbon-like protein [Mesorhizobium sp. RMAD-H1]|nr:putative RNA-binding Zn ribbon-like protein [Mesorhizobium sp. RMAD-H1]
MRLIGGRLALDFANTADWTVDNAVKHEKLNQWGDVEVWARAAGIEEALKPEPLNDLLALRAYVRGVFIRPKGTEPDIQAVNRLLAEIDPFARSKFTPRIALSAVSLLLDPNERSRIRMCSGHDCGWLFVDESPRKNRQWCAMDICGNREKARRHYERSRAARKP